MTYLVKTTQLHHQRVQIKINHVKGFEKKLSYY